MHKASVSLLASIAYIPDICAILLFRIDILDSLFHCDGWIIVMNTARLYGLSKSQKYELKNKCVKNTLKPV
jgi:hypothetical protein